MTQPRRSFPARAMARAGRALRLLLRPSFEEEEARLQKLMADVSRTAAGLDAQQAALKRLEGLIRAGHESAQTAAHQLEEAVAAERDRARAADRLLDRRLSRQWSALSRTAKRHAKTEGWQLDEVAVHERLSRVSAERGSIIVGPWTGEIGFELIYWVPFVRWAIDKYAIDPARLVILSRGGTIDWYGVPGARYTDALTLVDVDGYREGTSTRLKQRRVSLFDRRLVRTLRDQLDEGRCRLLHPGLMYQLFFPAWKQQAPTTRLAEYSRFARITATPPQSGDLPARYVAARFYFSNCFPDTAENRAAVAAIVSSLTEHTDVVWLTPGARVDEHAELQPPVSPRVHVFRATDPARNLADQTAVIAGAEAFVGTYGGFAYLAPFCGVDTLAWYSDANFFRMHLHRAEEGLAAVGGGRLLALDVASRPLLARISAGAGDAPHPHVIDRR